MASTEHSNTQNQDNPAPKTRTRKRSTKPGGNAKWTDANITRFLDYLTEHHSKAGNGGNFTVATFKDAADHMAQFEYEGGMKDANACKNKWGQLKGTCEVILKIKNKSGWTWSDDTGATIGMENTDLWDKFIKQKPATKPFRNKGWKFFHTVHNLLPATVKGTSVFRPTQGTQGFHNVDPAPSQPASQSEQPVLLQPGPISSGIGTGSGDDGGLTMSTVSQEREGSVPWDIDQLDKDMERDNSSSPHMSSAGAANSVLSIQTPKQPAVTPLASSSKKSRSSSDFLAGLMGEVSGMNETFRTLLAAPALPTSVQAQVPSIPVAPGTPARNCIATAVARAEEEIDLSDSDVAEFIHVVSGNVAVADAYNKITRPSLHTQFIMKTVKASSTPNM
ncbi:hypothetical protein VKT23_017660 [Stygiomarasmius scandens]|uniref:Myb/SANT-like domain-containing protein n=1 Tax=Marasmiellus scandens TaxID=2682957 RepID=A0ABR1ITQ9_9AGAR